MTINYKYDNICVNKDSNACELLINNKQKIIELNNLYNNNINDFVGHIGNFERGAVYGLPLVTLDNIIQNILKDDFFTKLKSIISTGNFKTLMQRNIMFDGVNNMFYIERKTVESTKIKKTKYTIPKVTFFGAGNLSISILLHIMYLKNDETNISFSETIAKIYPLVIVPSNGYDLYKEGGSINQGKRDKFNQVMEFIFYKEALLNCWIKNNLISNRITNTFVCALDSYISNSLPLTKSDLLFLKDKEVISGSDIFKKKWVKNNINTWENLFGNPTIARYGIIEMEKVDFTVREMQGKTMLDLGMIFEIFYSKLCLAFIGNLFMADDHFNNIMVKYTNKIRKYTIKRRNTNYVFYVDNNYIIKYIDMERYTVSTNRNKFLNIPIDIVLQNEYITYNYLKNTTERNICRELFNYIKNENHDTIDEFAEIFYRYLPDKYTNAALYAGKNNIDEYIIDLDVENPANFLGDIVANTIPLDQPFNLISNVHSGGYNKKAQRNNFIKYV